MKVIPYSPFNRTYTYMCFQNQLAHKKNKSAVKGLVNSNLNVKRMRSSSAKKSTQRSNMSKSRYSSTMMSDSFFSQGLLKESPRIIHKNYFYDKKIQGEIEKDNQRMKKKISQTNCRVEKNSAILRESVQK